MYHCQVVYAAEIEIKKICDVSYIQMHFLVGVNFKLHLCPFKLSGNTKEGVNTSLVVKNTSAMDEGEHYFVWCHKGMTTYGSCVKGSCILSFYGKIMGIVCCKLYYYACI